MSVLYGGFEVSASEAPSTAGQEDAAGAGTEDGTPETGEESTPETAEESTPEAGEDSTPETGEDTSETEEKPTDGESSSGVGDDEDTIPLQEPEARMLLEEDPAEEETAEEPLTASFGQPLLRLYATEADRSNGMPENPGVLYLLDAAPSDEAIIAFLEPSANNADGTTMHYTTNFAQLHQQRMDTVAAANGVTGARAVSALTMRRSGEVLPASLQVTCTETDGEGNERSTVVEVPMAYGHHGSSPGLSGNNTSQKFEAGSAVDLPTFLAGTYHPQYMDLRGYNYPEEVSVSWTFLTSNGGSTYDDPGMGPFTSLAEPGTLAFSRGTYLLQMTLETTNGNTASVKTEIVVWEEYLDPADFTLSLAEAQVLFAAEDTGIRDALVAKAGKDGAVCWYSEQKDVPPQAADERIIGKPAIGDGFVWADPQPGQYTVTFAGGNGKTGSCTMTILLDDTQGEYTLAYEGNGAESGVPSGGNYDEGVAVGIPDESPVRVGYHFKGWLVRGSDPEVLRQPGEAFTMPAENVTLVAQWTAYRKAEIYGRMLDELGQPMVGVTVTLHRASIFSGGSTYNWSSSGYDPVPLVTDENGVFRYVDEQAVPDPAQSSFYYGLTFPACPNSQTHRGCDLYMTGRDMSRTFNNTKVWYDSGKFLAIGRMGAVGNVWSGTEAEPVEYRYNGSYYATDEFRKEIGGGTLQDAVSYPSVASGGSIATDTPPAEFVSGGITYRLSGWQRQHYVSERAEGSVFAVGWVNDGERVPYYGGVLPQFTYEEMLASHKVIYYYRHDVANISLYHLCDECGRAITTVTNPRHSNIAVDLYQADGYPAYCWTNNTSQWCDNHGKTMGHRLSRIEVKAPGDDAPVEVARLTKDQIEDGEVLATGQRYTLAAPLLAGEYEVYYYYTPDTYEFEYARIEKHVYENGTQVRAGTTQTIGRNARYEPSAPLTENSQGQRLAYLGYRVDDDVTLHEGIPPAVEAVRAGGTYTYVYRVDNDRTWTVTFESNGGTPVGPITGVPHATAISAPTAPTKAGNLFVAWYRDEDLTQIWNFTTDRVTEDITLYAKWQPFTLPNNFAKYVYNGSRLSDTLSLTTPGAEYTYAIRFTMPPSIAGYEEIVIEDVLDARLEYLGSTGTLSFTEALEEATNTLRITLPPDSLANRTVEIQVKVKLRENLEDLSDILNTATMTVNGEHESETPNPPVVELDFAHTVTFEPNGGTAVDPLAEVPHGETIDEPTPPQKPSYDFAGWYKDDGLTMPWDFATDTVTEDITLYAKWEPKPSPFNLTKMILADGQLTGSHTITSPSEQVTYHIRFELQKTDAYTALVLEDALDARLEYLSGKITVNGAEFGDYAVQYDDGTNLLTFTFADLTGLADSTVEIELTVALRDSVEDHGVIINTASLAVNGGEPVITPDPPVLNLDFGYIAGYVFEDLDGNGTRDVNSRPVAGHTVKLLYQGADGWIHYGTAVTNEEGYYQFTAAETQARPLSAPMAALLMNMPLAATANTALPFNTYMVVAELQNGYAFTAPAEACSDYCGMHSNIDTATGQAIVALNGDMRTPLVGIGIQSTSAVPAPAGPANPGESTASFWFDAAGTLHLAPQTSDLIDTAAIVLSIAISVGLLATGIYMQVAKRKKGKNR